MFFGPCINGFDPGSVRSTNFFKVMIACCQPVIHLSECNFTICNNGNIHSNVFTDGSGVNINVDDFRMGCKRINPTGNTVIKAGTNGNQKITFGHSHIGGIASVHTEHSHRERITAGESAKPHKSHGNRNIEFFCQLSKLFIAVGENNTATNIEYRLLGF